MAVIFDGELQDENGNIFRPHSNSKTSVYSSEKTEASTTGEALDELYEKVEDATGIVNLSQEEYDALSYEEKMNGKAYFVNTEEEETDDSINIPNATELVAGLMTPEHVQTLNEHVEDTDIHVSTEDRTKWSQMETDIAVERARIDVMQSLPEGSTSGDAALEDIKVGYDGTVWDTPGNAVRGQVSQLSNENDRLFKSNNNKVSYDDVIWNLDKTFDKTNKKIISSNGLEAVTDLIRINSANNKFTMISDTCGICVVFYDKFCNVLGFLGSNYSGTHILDNNGASYIRVVAYSDDGLTVEQLQGISLYFWDSTSKHLNVKEMGATGEYSQNATPMLKEAISIINENGGSVYIPEGNYKITAQLGTLTNGELYGDYSSSDVNFGTVIRDERSALAGAGSNIALLQLDGKYKVHDLTFYGSGILNNCIIADGGWDATMKNVCIQQYKNVGLICTGEDQIFDTVFLLSCGSIEPKTETSLVRPALHLYSNANCNRFINCHLEHCRYLIKFEGAHANVFKGCHIEQSARGITALNPTSPIHFGKSDYRNIFSECIFAPINADTYEENEISPVSFITNLGYLNIFNSCSFACGMGSGDVAGVGSLGAKYIDSSNGKIQIENCVFQNASNETPFVLGDNSIFCGNNITYHNDGDGIIFKSGVSAIANNIFTTDTEHSTIEVDENYYSNNIII